jgi:hypothetical protein
MCKEMPVILVNKVVDPKKINQKNWRAGEEERHKGSFAQKTHFSLEPNSAPIFKTNPNFHVAARGRVARFFLVQYTKITKNIPDYRKIYQMTIICI